MPGSSATQTLHQLRVLIVDDNDVNREFLRAGLTTMVDHIEVAADGQEAVELCRERRFDVVLMDLHMPRMDGLSAFHRIRQPGLASQAARIIMLTADARPDERARMLEHGVDEYLNKPISIPQLTRALLDQFNPGNADQSELPDEDMATRLIVPEQSRAVANGDEELAARMSLLFGQELERKLPDLDGMIQRGEFHQAAALLHQWRGASGFAGAARLHQACGRLHKRLLADEDRAAGTAYVEFLRVAHATCQALLTRPAQA